MKETLEQHEVNAIVRALKEGARVHDTHALTMAKLAQAGGNGLVSSDTAHVLSASHRQISEEFEALSEKMENSHGVWTLIE